MSQAYTAQSVCMVRTSAKLYKMVACSFSWMRELGPATRSVVDRFAVRVTALPQIGRLMVRQGVGGTIDDKLEFVKQ